MKTIIKNMLLIIGMMTSTNSFSATCTALADGDWSDGSNWSCGSVPGCGDIIIIPAGITVQLDMMVNLDESSMPACNSPVQIIVFGILRMQTGRKMYLSCGSTVEIMVGGQLRHGVGGGMSNVLEICGVQEWASSDGHVPGYHLFGTPSPMPTTLVSFDASLEQNTLTVNWTVESERMVDLYSIEVSNDYNNWTEVATEKSVGDHSTRQDYSVSTSISENNAMYARLIVRDMDGTSQVLDTRSVKAGSSVEIYPNPATPSDNIKMSGLERGTVIIFDQQGSIVAEIDVENSILNTSEMHLKQGVYLIKIAETGQMIRLLIQ